MKYIYIIIKLLFSSLVILSLNSPLLASRPLAGITGVKPENIRVTGMSAIFENQLVNVLNSSGVFDIINPELLKDQLTRFGCTEEDCIISFAKTAKISVIVRGLLQDKGDTLNVVLYSQGIDFPYYGKIIYEYSAKIPLKGLKLAVNEYNLIAEEHAGFFVSGMLKVLKTPALISNDISGLQSDDCDIADGIYDLYRYGDIPDDQLSIRTADRIGKIKIAEKKLQAVDGASMKQGDFILTGYADKSKFIEEVVYGRKRELVFSDTPSRDAGILFFSIVPASVLMPLVAPISYYNNNDFSGLLLWTINCTPYLYLGYPGLKNRFEVLIRTENEVSEGNIASYRFGAYLLLTGGIPMIMDAFTNKIMYLGRSYQGRQPYIGSNLSAVILSVISGGGGHFYKGYRLQGYLYFHLNNILVYSIIKNYSMKQRDDHVEKEINLYLGAYGLLKVAEITHLLLIRDNIRNGIVTERAELLPTVNIINGELNIGLQYGVRF